jgi:peptidoglycan hydrolase CwlO-like protein
MGSRVDSTTLGERSRAKRGRPAGMRALAIAVAGAALAITWAQGAGAQSVGELNSKIADARAQAQSLSAEVDAKGAQLAAAQQQAAAAAQREAELTAVLQQGQAREAALQVRVEDTQSHLQVVRAHLRRALGALSDRLVSIYKGDAPNTAELLLSAKGFDDLANRAELVGRIEDSDAALASRVRELRREVAALLAQVREARNAQAAENQRVASARDQIASVRANAEAQAARLEQARAEEAAAVQSLQSQVAGWEQQVQQAIAAQQAQEAQQAQQATAAQAQQTVSDWVGNYAIPQAIVMCESGGNFSALNPSSGAGGAYQILPSTWRLYGGSGSPQDASPQQQSQIASQIWADSGPSAWECAQ